MPHRVALLAALVCAPFAPPAMAEESAGGSMGRAGRFRSAPVEITSPLATDTLHAGESILLSWQALPEIEHHSGFEEWEAFLSLDDGASYSVRLTPHLDLGRRSFSATLPPFATQRARLLLRFGDEEEELEFEVPGVFEIRAASGPDLASASPARGRGEPARLEDPRDPGVASWVEGTREGRATRTVVAAADGAGLDAVLPRDWIGFGAATAAPAPPQAAAAEPSTHPFTGLFASTPTALPAAPRAAPIEPRRTTCRQNE